MKNSGRTGFTLIELLIVVAIVSILATIAIPSLQTGYVRAKISRAHSDMKTLYQSLYSYYLDTRHFPPEDAPYQIFRIPSHLTSPIAYMQQLPHDPFASIDVKNPDYFPEVWRRYVYQNFSQYFDVVVGCGIYTEDKDYARFGPWLLNSVGPDHVYSGGITFHVSNGMQSVGDLHCSYRYSITQ